MPGLIEKYKRDTFTLKRRSGISDGKPTFSSETCEGLSLDMTKEEISVFGLNHRGKVFYVCPLETTPQLPCKITFDGLDYDVQTIEVLRTLRGELWGYRMIAFGA